MDASISIKTKQGNVSQDAPTTADFTVEISAVADAPELHRIIRDENGDPVRIMMAISPMKLSM